MGRGIGRRKEERVLLLCRKLPGEARKDVNRQAGRKKGAVSWNNETKTGFQCVEMTFLQGK
jgi:hypothetical protein